MFLEKFLFLFFAMVRCYTRKISVIKELHVQNQNLKVHVAQPGPSAGSHVGIRVETGP